MIAGAQLRAARALLGLDQRALAKLCGLSLPTIQRMETSPGSVRAVVDSLDRVVQALTSAGVEMIPDGVPSAGVGRGVRLLDRVPVHRPTRPAQAGIDLKQKGGDAV
jgi:transcriptional regulator with XRE-family HTH domain